MKVLPLTVAVPPLAMPPPEPAELAVKVLSLTIIADVEEAATNKEVKLLVKVLAFTVIAPPVVEMPPPFCRRSCW